jgi:hypothetical protein
MTATIPYDMIRTAKNYHAMVIGSFRSQFGAGDSKEAAVADLEARHPEVKGKLRRVYQTVYASPEHRVD